MAFKTSAHQRTVAAAYKLANWNKTRKQMKDYMRNYRKTPKGKKVVIKANRAWVQRNLQAIAMYNLLTRLAKADGVGFKRRTTKRTIIQDGTLGRKIR